MDVVMSLLSYIKWHVFHLIYEMAFYSILFAAISIVLFWICNKCGWTKINDKGPKWFIILFALTILIVSAGIGGHLGFQVGVSKITVKIVDDSGQMIIEKGIMKAAQSLNVDINQKIDVREAKLLFNKMEKMKLVDSKGWSADILNEIYKMLVVPFVLKTEAYTNQLAPNSEIIPAQIINSTWNNYNKLVKEESKKINDAAILHGISLALAFIFIPVFVVSVIRVCISIAKQSITETPQKVMDEIQPVNNDGDPALLLEESTNINDSLKSSDDPNNLGPANSLEDESRVTPPSLFQQKAKSIAFIILGSYLILMGVGAIAVQFENGSNPTIGNMIFGVCLGLMFFFLGYRAFMYRNIVKQKNLFSFNHLLSLIGYILLVICVAFVFQKVGLVIDGRQDDAKTGEEKSGNIVGSVAVKDKEIDTESTKTEIPPKDANNMNERSDITSDNIQSLRQEFLDADKEINAVYKDTMSKLSPGGKAELKREQISWIKEKESKCDAETDKTKRLTCLINMTNDRTDQLRKW